MQADRGGEYMLDTVRFGALRQNGWPLWKPVAMF